MTDVLLEPELSDIQLMELITKEGYYEPLWELVAEVFLENRDGFPLGAASPEVVVRRVARHYEQLSQVLQEILKLTGMSNDVPAECLIPERIFILTDRLLSSDNTFLPESDRMFLLGRLGLARWHANALLKWGGGNDHSDIRKAAVLSANAVICWRDLAVFVMNRFGTVLLPAPSLTWAELLGDQSALGTAHDVAPVSAGKRSAQLLWALTKQAIKGSNNRLQLQNWLDHRRAEHHRRHPAMVQQPAGDWTDGPQVSLN